MFGKFLLPWMATLLVLFFFHVPSGFAQCHSSIDLSTMDKDFLAFLKMQGAGTKAPIAIMPLYDNHIGIPDDTLFYGLPFVIFDMFADSNPQILHPYLSLDAIESLGIKGEALTQKDSLKKVAEKLAAKYVIFGSFQRSFYQTIRIIINVYDLKTGNILSPAMEFSTDFNDSVFVQINHSIHKAFAKLKSAPKLKKTGYIFPTMQTFRFYSKGLAYARNYNQNNLQVAALWFEKALKESYQKYDDAALNLARAHFMMGLLQKMNKTDFSQEWQKGQMALSFISSQPKKPSTKYLFTLRYIRGQTAFLRGMTAREGSNTGQAATLAKEGLALLPEDGMMQNLYLMSVASNNLGNFTIKNALCL